MGNQQDKNTKQQLVEVKKKQELALEFLALGYQQSLLTKICDNPSISAIQMNEILLRASKNQKEENDYNFAIQQAIKSSINQQKYNLPKNEFQTESSIDMDDELQAAMALSVKIQVQQNEENPESRLRTEDPIGLQNLGLTCYFNSFLQTLFHIRELRDPILKLELTTEQLYLIEPCSKQAKLIEMLRQLQLIFAIMLKSQLNCADPSKLFSSFEELSPVFQLNEENDLQEFQNLALEFLEQAFRTDSDFNTADMFKSYLNLRSKLPLGISEIEINQHKVSQNQQNQIQAEVNNDYGSDQKQKKQSESIAFQGDVASPRKRKIEQIQNAQKTIKKVKNPITELFFGFGEETVIMYPRDQKLLPVISTSTTNIGTFNLDVIHSDLLNALRQFFSYSVVDEENYEMEKAEVKAQIKVPPKIMNFYINRIRYCQFQKKAVKYNQLFTFPKEIFIDEFMKEKQIILTEANNQISKIDLKLNDLKQKLESYSNYNIKGGGLILAYEIVLEHLKSQIQNKGNEIQFDSMKIQEIEKINNHQQKPPEQSSLENSIYFLQDSSQNLKKEVQELVKQIEELKLQKESYQRQKQTIKYEIFSILIHEGFANSGHYYCYVFDDKKQCWFKFNDSKVCKVLESEVFLQSFGQEGSNRNACCLYYKNSQTKVNPMKPVELSARLKNEVLSREKYFLDQVDQFRIRKKFDDIEQKYLSFMKEQENSIFLYQTQKAPMNMFTQFFKASNFPLYLINSRNNPNLGQRNILINIMIKEDFSSFETLIQKKESLKKGQSQFYEHMTSTHNIPGPNLTREQQQLLSKEEMNYQNLNDILKMISVILYESTSFSYRLKMLGCLKKSIDSNKEYQNNQFFLMISLNVQEILDIFMLKACFEIDKCIQLENIEKSLEILNHLVLIYLEFYQKEKKQDSLINDVAYKIKSQISANLNCTRNSIENKCSQEQFSWFAGQVFLLQNPNNFSSYKMKLEQYFNEPLLNDNYQKQKFVDTLNEVLSNFDQFNQKNTVWINQVEQLRKQQGIISQEERLNHEEILYFDPE